MKLNVNEDHTGLSIKFGVRPSDFFYKQILNLATWLIVQIIGIILINKYALTESGIFEISIFAIATLTLIRAPAIDSFYVFKDYGVQLSTTKGWVILPHAINCKLFTTTEFIPNDELVDIVINEGFKGISVVFYLCIIVNRSSKLTIVFPVSIN